MPLKDKAADKVKEALNAGRIAAEAVAEFTDDSVGDTLHPHQRLKRLYKFTGGGSHRHDGVSYRKGMDIWLTDAEAQGASFKDRLSLVAAEVASQRAIAETQFRGRKPADPVKNYDANETPGRDWSHIVSMDGAELLQLVRHDETLTIDDIKAMKVIERGGKARRGVLNSLEKRLRQFNAKKAQAALAAKRAAAKKTEAEEGDSSDGSDGSDGSDDDDDENDNGSDNDDGA